MYQTLNYAYSYVFPAPTAHITVGHNRLKLYGKFVYLKDDSNFEIELFNPRTVRVLAKITINGTSISGGGIVVNPGQRVYLERFLDEDRRFKFSTYEAENSAEGRSAIRNNGEITVEFYDEIVKPQLSWTSGCGTITIPSNIVFPSSHTTNSGGYVGQTLTNQQCYFNSTLDNGEKTNISAVYGAMINDASANLDSQCCCDSFETPKGFGGAGGTVSSCLPPTIETGRVEKGDRSGQRLNETYGDFSFVACATYSVKILPKSQEPVEIGDVRVYCSHCGRRWRANENFCPKCGTPKDK